MRTNRSYVLKNLLMILIPGFLTACSVNTEHSDASGDDGQKITEWPEMEAFHNVMAECYHPYMDSANLEPAKRKSKAMASAAKKWAGSPLPPMADNDEIRSLLHQLETETDSFVLTASGNDDDATGRALTSVHGIFHKIGESWHAAQEADGEH